MVGRHHTTLFQKVNDTTSSKNAFPINITIVKSESKSS